MSRRAFGIVAALLFSGLATADGWKTDGYYNAPNTGTIVNTGHNLTASYAPMAGFMLSYRNNYPEVCVFCHTPHGANSTINAPLWNRTNPGNTYTLYNIPTTLGQPITQPGPSSLTCLSCHDGSVAIDSVINMPGPGKYSSGQQTAVSTAFLNTWVTPATNHSVMGPATGDASTDCTRCHSIPGVGLGMSDFSSYLLGTDLRNDHPVGIKYPTAFGSGIDFNSPTVTAGNLAYFDTNGNSHADSWEIRLYESGDGYEVECATCHDPHGVRTGGAGSALIPTFLRVSNAQSALCRTCHVK